MFVATLILWALAGVAAALLIPVLLPIPRWIPPAAAVLVPLLCTIGMLWGERRPGDETRFRIVGQTLPHGAPVRVGNGGLADVQVVGLGPAIPLEVIATYEAAADSFRIAVGPGPTPVAVGKRLVNGVLLGGFDTIVLAGPIPTRLTVRRPAWPVLCRLGIACRERIVTAFANGQQLWSRRVDIPRSGLLLSELGIGLPTDAMLLRWCSRRGALCSDVWLAGGAPGAIRVDGRAIPNRGWLRNSANDPRQQDTLRVGAGRGETKLVLLRDSVATRVLLGGRLWQPSWPLLPPDQDPVYRVAGGGLQPSAGTLPVLDLNTVPLGPKGRAYSGVLQHGPTGWEWHSGGQKRYVKIQKLVDLPGTGSGHIVRFEKSTRALTPLIIAGALAWLLGVLVASQPPAQATPLGLRLRTAILGVAYTILALRTVLAWRVGAAPPSDWKGLETTLLTLSTLPVLVWWIEDSSRWGEERRRSLAIAASGLLLTVAGATVGVDTGSVNVGGIFLERLFAFSLVVGIGVYGLRALSAVLARTEPKHGTGHPGRAGLEREYSHLFALEPEQSWLDGRSILLLYRAISLLLILNVAYTILSVWTRPALWMGILLVYLVGVAAVYVAAWQRTGVRPILRRRTQLYLTLGVAGISGLFAPLAAGELARHWGAMPLLMASISAAVAAALLTRWILSPSVGALAGPTYPVRMILPPLWVALAVPTLLPVVLLSVPATRRLTIVLGYSLALAGLIVVARVFVLYFTQAEVDTRPRMGFAARPKRRLLPVVLVLVVFAPFVVADQGLLVLTLGSALVVTLLTLSLRGRWAVLGWSAASIGIVVVGLGLLRLPLATLGEPTEPVLWFSMTSQVRAAAAWAPERLEDQLVRATNEDAGTILRTLQQQWGMRTHSAAGGLAGLGFFGAPFSGHAIPADVAMTDNVTSVFLLSEHGLVGGMAVLVLYLLAGLVFLFAARRASRHFRDMGRAALLTGLGLLLVIPTLYMVAANVSAVPLTGQNVPLLGLRSTADAAFGAWLFMLALAALPRAPDYGWEQPDSNTRVRRESVRRGITWVGAASVMATVMVTALVAEGTSATAEPFSLDRLHDALAERVHSRTIAVDTLSGDTLILTQNGSQALKPGGFLHRLVAESNALSHGRRVPENDCLSMAPVLSVVGRKEVSVDRTVCRLRLPFEGATPWRGVLSAGPVGVGLSVTSGDSGVTLSAGARSRAVQACGSASLPETSRATLQCSGDQIDLVPDATGAYYASYVRGAVIARPKLRRGLVLNTAHSTLLVDSLPRGGYGFSRWRNGEYTRSVASAANPFLGRLDALLGAGLQMDRVAPDADVRLTLRPGLMTELDSTLSVVCPALGPTVLRCTVPVVDPATGDILALSSWTRGSAPSHKILEPSFRTRLSASTFKPLLAGAVLSVYPQLVGLAVPYSESSRSVVGWPLEAELTSALHAPCRAPTIAFDCFLGGSNNLYAASLGLLALAPPDPATGLPRMEPAPGTAGFSIGPHAYRYRPQIMDPAVGVPQASRSPLAAALHRLYGAGVARGGGGDGMDRSLWAPMESAGMVRPSSAWESVSPQVPRLPLDDLSEDPKPLWALTTFMYGDRENYWSNIIMVRGLVRLMNGRGTNLRLIDQVGGQKIPNPDTDSVGFGPMRDTILAGMRDVVHRGTAASLVPAARIEANGFHLYGKTGTLNNTNPRISAFLFGVLPPGGVHPTCTGAAGMVYVEHERGSARTAAEVFARSIAPVLNRHLRWDSCRRGAAP